MSTKIYNAYITTADITRLFSVFKSLRKPMLDRWETRINDAMERVEAIANTAEEREKKRLDLACRLCLDVISNSHASPTCQVGIYPIIKKNRNFHPGATCVFQLFGLDRDLDQDAVKRLKGKDFHYQNQSDPDEKAEASGEWDYREKFWDKMFSESDFPCDNSFGFDIVSKKHALEKVWERYTVNQNKDRPSGKQWCPISTAIYRAGDMVPLSGRNIRPALVAVYPEHLKEHATAKWGPK